VTTTVGSQTFLARQVFRSHWTRTVSSGVTPPNRLASSAANEVGTRLHRTGGRLDVVDAAGEWNVVAVQGDSRVRSLMPRLRQAVSYWEVIQRSWMLRSLRVCWRRHRYGCLRKMIVAPNPCPGCVMVPVIVSPLIVSSHLAPQHSSGSPAIRSSST